jgi:hypothetical protein
MPAHPVPLARLSVFYRRKDERRRLEGDVSVLGRMILWGGGLVVAALLYFGVPYFWNWKHVIASSGGRYFVHRVEIPVPAFQQGDPRWGSELLGPTYDTIGQAGCAITSAAMVMAAYGVDIDPHRLNVYLNGHQGYTPNGYVYWEKAAETAPYGQVEKAYEDIPAYALLDHELLGGNPVIVRLKLRNGTPHFVVVVGKEGWNYLIRDPARPESWGVYPLKDLTDHIEGLRYFRVLPPTMPPVVPTPATNPVPAVTVTSPTPSSSPTPATSSQNP